MKDTPDNLSNLPSDNSGIRRRKRRRKSERRRRRKLIRLLKKTGIFLIWMTLIVLI